VKTRLIALWHQSVCDIKIVAAGRCFRTRTKAQARKSVTPPRLAIDASIEEKRMASNCDFRSGPTDHDSP
jgi:hypothetical protein